MARRPARKPVTPAPSENVEAPASKESQVPKPAPAPKEPDTIKVMLVTPYPQIMPDTGIRFLPNDPVLAPNNAWVKARIKDGMLAEVAV